MTGPVQPAAGSDPDASAVYTLGSSKGESDRLLRQAGELAADNAALLDGWACGQGTASSILAAVRGGSSACLPIGYLPAVGWWAWMPTQRMPRWRPSSS